METVLRFRPRTQSDDNLFEVNTECTTVSVPLNCKSYTVDHVFDETSTNEKLFQVIGRPIIDNVIKGYNANLFAYGQTASGKTHTIFGHQNNNALAFQCLQYLFAQLSEISSVKVSVSAVEIYNNQIYDQLGDANNRKKLKLCLTEIKGVSKVIVRTFDDICYQLRNAINNRTTFSTQMNDKSSRSHLIIIVRIKQKTVISKLHFIDLAGSERVSDTKSEGLRLKEANSINKSLLTLGRVIDSLIIKSAHIPYYDCKMTQLLSDSFGGNSMTTMIGCVSSDECNLRQSLNTFHFIARAKQIQNIPKINRCRKKQLHMLNIEMKKRIIDEQQKQITEYRLTVDSLSAENLTLQNAIENMQKELESENDNSSSLDISVCASTEISISSVSEKCRYYLFFEAVEKCDIATAEKLMSFVDINQKIGGEGILTSAIKSNNIKMLIFLLGNGADPNVANINSLSPLMIAVVCQRIKCCQILCESKTIDIEQTNSLGCTAIHISASHGFWNITELLLKHNAHINVRNARGWTPLMFSCKLGCLATACILLDNSANVNDANDASATAVTLAAFAGHTDMVGLLMANGADCSIHDKHGMSAHIWARKKKYTQINDMFNAYGFKLTFKDRVMIVL